MCINMDQYSVDTHTHTHTNKQIHTDGTLAAVGLPSRGLIIEREFVVPIVQGQKLWEIRAYPPPPDRVGRRIAALSTGCSGHDKFKGEFVLAGYR